MYRDREADVRAVDQEATILPIDVRENDRRLSCIYRLSAEKTLKPPFSEIPLVIQ